MRFETCICQKLNEKCAFRWFMLHNNHLYLATVSKAVKVTDFFLIHNLAEIIRYETVL